MERLFFCLYPFFPFVFSFYSFKDYSIHFRDLIKIFALTSSSSVFCVKTMKFWHFLVLFYVRVVMFGGRKKKSIIVFLLVYWQTIIIILVIIEVIGVIGWSFCCFKWYQNIKSCYLVWNTHRGTETKWRGGGGEGTRWEKKMRTWRLGRLANSKFKNYFRFLFFYLFSFSLSVLCWYFCVNPKSKGKN